MSMAPEPQRESVHSLLPLAIQAPGVIEEVIRDMELLKDPATHILPVVDPHDIIEFCFPFGPIRGANPDARAADIADAQAAWYELFYHWSERPVLLREYVEEVVGFNSYLRWQVKHVYEPIEVVKRLIETADYDSSKGKAKESLLKLAGEEFNIALAVVMGLHSFGIGRFNELLRQRVQLEDSAFAVDEHLRQLSTHYRPTPLQDKILAALQDYTKKRADDADSIARKKMKEANEADASVIDKLLYLNREMLALHAKGVTKKRFLLVYISSSERSRFLFNTLPEVEKASPKVGGTRFNILRTRDHWIAYVFSKSTRSQTGERGTWADETISQLKATHSLATSVAGMWDQRRPSTAQCSQCVLRGGESAGCEYETICRALRGQALRIAEQRNTYENLTLSANAKSYADVLSSITQKVKHGTGGVKQIEEYVHLLESFISNSDLVDLALKKMKALEEILETQSTFGGIAAGVISREQEGALAQQFGEDRITIVEQYLPVRPRIVDEPYRSILNLIIEFYTAPHTTRDSPANRAKFHKAFAQYFEAEGHAVMLSGEHELIRCYLYLAFGSHEGDEKALERAGAVLLTPSRFCDLRAEFYCVACWAARRVRRYQTAEAYIRDALLEYPSDARYYHARALNILAWSTDEQHRSTCRFSLNDAVGACKHAIDLYSKDRPETDDLLGTCFCDLALFLSMAPKDPVFDLKGARTALDELKRINPKAQWKPKYPEFYYMEALIEWREFQYLRRTGHPVADLCYKLHRALIEANNAVELPKKPHLELQKKVASTYQKLECWSVMKAE